MKKLMATLFWATILSIAAFAQPQPPDTLWTMTYGGINADEGRSVQQTQDEGFIITGYTTSYGVGLKDVYLTKTDALGNEEWSQTFGGISDDIGNSVQQTSDGGYIIAGQTSSYGSGLLDVYLIKTDASGNELWFYTFGESDNDYGNSVQQTQDGGYIIVGYTSSYGVGSGDVYLIKTDALGNELWFQTFGGSNNDWGLSVQQTTDEGYIVAGMTASYGAGGNDVYLIKTDASGNELWNQTFGGSNWDEGLSVQQTQDGGYIIAGYTESYGSGPLDVYLIKTDAAGNELWFRTFGGNGPEVGNSVQQTQDGGYIIAGHTYSYGAGSSDVYLIKTDASGNELWFQTFGGSSLDRGLSVQQTQDEGYIIAGYTASYGAGGWDVYLIRLEAESPPPQLTITLTPSVTPVQIPPGGGSFLYDISIENIDTIGGFFDGWINAILPDSTIFGPIILRQNIYLEQGGTILREDMTQFVPARAPSGNYSYVGNVGLYPDEIIDSDSFTFEKLPGFDSQNHNFGWALFGWDEENAPTASIPTEYATISAYPNPFNPETNLMISLQTAADVTLSIYDTQGREVTRLMDAWYPSGTYRVSFDGSQLSSGMYFASLRANDVKQTVKLLLIK